MTELNKCSPTANTCACECPDVNQACPSIKQGTSYSIRCTSRWIFLPTELDSRRHLKWWITVFFWLVGKKSLRTDGKAIWEVCVCDFAWLLSLSIRYLLQFNLRILSSLFKILTIGQFLGHFLNQILSLSTRLPLFQDVTYLIKAHLSVFVQDEGLIIREKAIRFDKVF